MVFLFGERKKDLYSVFYRVTGRTRLKSVRIIMSGNSFKTGAVAKTRQVVRERALAGPKVSNTANNSNRNNQQSSSAAMLVLEKGKKPVGLANSKTLELSRLSLFLMLQEAFKCISCSASRADLLHGLSGAPMFSQVDLKTLDDFILEISLRKKGQHNNIGAQADAAAVHYQKLLDNCKEKVAGSFYCEIKSMVDRLIASDYLAIESDTENLEPGQPEKYPFSQLGSVVKDEELISNSVVNEVMPEESPRRVSKPAYVTKRASMYRTPLRPPPRRASRGFTVSLQLDEGDSKRLQFSLAISAQNPKLIHWNKFTPRRTPLYRPAKHSGVLKNHAEVCLQSWK